MKEFIKILLRFVPPYKRYFFANIFCNLFSTVLSLFSFAIIIPLLEILFGIEQKSYVFMEWGAHSFKDAVINNFYWFMTSLIDEHGKVNVLIMLGFFLVVMTFLKVMTAYASAYFVIPLRSGVVRDIRIYVFRTVVGLPIGYFTTERKGDIMARMSGDVSQIESSVMSSLDLMFKNPIMILIYLVTMFIISWQLTLFVLVLLPISGYIMGTIGKKLKRHSVEAQDKWGELMSQIEEVLGGLRIIKAFNAEGKIVNRFEHTNNLFRDMSNNIARRQSLAHPMSEFLGTATIAVVLWYGGSLILEGDNLITASSFIYYLVIFYSVINPAKEFSRAAYAVQSGLASMERVDKILAAKNPITEVENPKPLTAFTSQIEFRNASFRYANDWVVNDVSVVIPKGKTIALVGQSGSGKSTMADLVPRFYDVEQGGIYIDGINIKEVDVHALRELMGNVNQEAILFNDTFYNNITFGVKSATEEQVISAAKIANAHEFIIATEDGYQTNIGDRGCRLSGGQRQRLSIARAILKNPPVLILDEATSALDTESERLVQDALESLMKNRTTLVIAHRLSTIKNADLICVMHEGRIVERGTHDELINLDKYYKRLVDMQSF